MNAEPAEQRHLMLLQLGQWEETRNTIFSKLLKLLSPCRLSSLFTFAPCLIFHVVQAAAYQAVRYTAEIMQVVDITRQSKHKSRKNVTL